MQYISKISFAAFMVILITLISTSEIQAQRLNLQKIFEVLESNDCATVGGGKIKVCKYDFNFENKLVEAIITRPIREEKFPSLMLLPGFERTAKDLIPYGVMYAHEGFASVAITPPGFGKSEGKPDFVGAETQKIFAAGWEKFKQESFVDVKKMGIYGHSRGGMAASLMALQLADAKAVVAASGIYDFQKAFDEIQFKGIKNKMLEESGMTDEEIKIRSSLWKMAKLEIPMLILHGEKDDKTLVNQAYLLRDKLSVLKKDFEIKIFPEAGHLLDENEVILITTDFFRRKLNISF